MLRFFAQTATKPSLQADIGTPMFGNIVSGEASGTTWNTKTMHSHVTGGVSVVVSNLYCNHFDHALQASNSAPPTNAGTKDLGH